MGNFGNKTILITGGTGSFGNAVLQRLLKTDFKEIRIFSRDELKQDVMLKQINNPKVKFYIGDVRDINSVNQAMQGVDLVFHAAALKQVPSCEFFPIQAVLTNIMGSNNVIESAIAYKVKKIVCLSTDKCVYPINAMGMTKSLMEKVAQAASRNLSAKETTVCCVRYGNVMCSRGSVIPLFIGQIKKNKPITITEPSMTRFLLPLHNAVDLVLFALKNAKQGDIFIRKSPASTIMDLAVALRNVFKSKVPVKTIGVRHGEKIHETFITIEELRKSEDLGNYFRIRMDSGDLNYDKYYTKGDKKEIKLHDHTSANAPRLNVKQIEKLLLTLPEVTSELKKTSRY
ncbi:MAG TPA: SDR family NAD(P)-dependent oxidoreductase [Elusimicrobiales bacterium]|nr:SDR family NAD(P)-dependent oxidoreductase [Elusimicrobiales bacterium]